MRYLSIILFIMLTYQQVRPENYIILDTGQEKCFNNTIKITCPSKASPFYGQDAQYQGNQPDYTDNGDGTITDNVTGLMWQKSPDFNGDGEIDYFDKKTYSDALSDADSFTLAGYDDWRLPTIKELYSLFMAFGTDPSGPDAQNLIPFIDTDYFPFGYGDESNGEREIDAQYATSTIYAGDVFDGMQAMFGVNFADGRIKGYPTDSPNPNAKDMMFYVKYVRGSPDYGKNDFVDNGNGTISDKATGLMWTKNDSQEGMNWEDALGWVQEKNEGNYLGYNDWRLPNVKELQSIVDYERSPTTTNTAAIDPMFSCSQITDEGGNINWPFYWTSTTHVSANDNTPGRSAMYVCFGQALGFMEMPPSSGDVSLMDVHGAGAQRSDPKTGNPDDYPQGFGPQGDVVRIYNYVRMVRDDGNPSSIKENHDTGFMIYPNPASEYIEINLGGINLDGINPTVNRRVDGGVYDEIKIYNTFGELVFAQEMLDTTTQLRIDISSFEKGVYFVRIGNVVEKIIKK